jgi:hypothetical protein
LITVSSSILLLHQTTIDASFPSRVVLVQQFKINSDNRPT